MAGNVDTKDLSPDLSRQLAALLDYLNPEDRAVTLKTLTEIFQNIILNPGVDKYRQIKIANKRFSNTVWKYPAGPEFMKMSGWILEGDHLRFTDDSNIKVVANLLTSGKQDKQVEQSSAIAALAGTYDSDGMCELPPEHQNEMFITIGCGDSLKLRGLLKQIKIPVNKILLYGAPLVQMALALRQIGIARILIKEYSLEINTPCLHKFIEHGAPESEVIDLITEFNIDIKDAGFISYALHCKCFEIVKYAIEKQGFDVNSVWRASDNDNVYSTLLHLAYYMNETAFAEYLISKGADKNATDTNGKKPMEYSGGIEAAIKHSEDMVQHRQMGLYGRLDIMRLCNEGYSEEEATKSVIQKFPTSKVETPKRDLNDVPTLKELNRYIIDMAPLYYDIGLELDVLNSQLKLIRNDPSLPDLKEKCRRMLEVWLENDISATWKKLCDALLETGQNVLADQIKLA